MYRLSDYDYDLSREAIAEKPCEKRSDSRLLCLGKKDGSILHRHFFEIENMLNPGDILVINNTKVIPARLYGKKDTGGKVEILILSLENPCQALIKSSKKLKKGSSVFFDNIKAEITGFENGIYHIEFPSKKKMEKLVYAKGKMPLPPYIKGHRKDDEICYQTVYAAKEGAVAAPTAGLHFTRSLMDKIRKKGAELVEITLHVGYGTFLPVRVEDIRDHKMHTERFDISEKAAAKINRAKENDCRIIAVGTTSMRSLESVATNFGEIKAQQGECDLFIYPGYRFKAVDAMITNFHLPKSTLLMLAAAFAGYENIFNAYEEAIKKKYRFYSYGDAMFIY